MKCNALRNNGEQQLSVKYGSGVALDKNTNDTASRSSRSEVFCKQDIQVSQNSQESTSDGVFFLTKSQSMSPATLLKTDSSVGVLLWILRDF